MSQADNSVTLIGNLTRDPELRYTKSGTAVANVGLAVNRQVRGEDGEWDSVASFIDITIWDVMAENLAESLGKGDRVIVRGRFEQEHWETEDGDPRSKIVVIAEDIAPSLRWATAEVTKNERDGGESKSSGGRSKGKSAGGRKSAPSRGRSSGGGRSRPAKEEYYDEDEEPF